MENLTEQLRGLADSACAWCKDIANPEWEAAGRVHDWRNYVPECVKESWGSLSERERLLVIVLAEEAASSEEWD